MKYYGLSYARDLEVIGFYPQTAFWAGYNLETPNSHRNVYWNKFPEFTPNYQIELNEKAVATDFLDAVDLPTGCVLSEKMKNILLDFHLPTHKFYPIKVHHKNEVLEYYWLQIISDIWEYVDMEKSSIEIFHKFNFKVIDKTPIHTMDFFMNLKQNLPFEHGIRINEIVLNHNFPNYDIFDLTVVQFAILISEQLLDSIKKHGITGYVALEWNKLKSRTI